MTSARQYLKQRVIGQHLNTLIGIEDAPKQVDVALGIEPDHRLAPAYVLRKEHFDEPQHRVLPTRIVPSTSLCPTRSPTSINMSDSAGSTPWMAGSLPKADCSGDGGPSESAIRPISPGCSMSRFGETGFA